VDRVLNVLRRRKDPLARRRKAQARYEAMTPEERQKYYVNPTPWARIRRFFE
jgi:hypothetical protein